MTTIKITRDQAIQLNGALEQAVAEQGDWRAALQEAQETVNGWVESTDPEERVVFRVFPHDGAVIALFPDQYNDRNGMIGSYMELGQHCDTMPDFGDTKPATWDQYANLYRELQRQGYTRLKVVKRITIRK